MNAAMNAAGIHAIPDDPSNSGRFTDPAADSGERTYALFNHLAGLASFVSGGIPLGGIISTLILWKIKAKDSPFLDDHGREAVNFQISQIVYAVGGSLTIAMLTVITFGAASPLFGFFWLGLLALNAVGCIRGAMAANRREYYRYPMSIRFISGSDEVG